MTRSSAPWLVFLVVGVAFVAVGASGRQAFLIIGAAFLVLGLVGMGRARKASG